MLRACGALLVVATVSAADCSTVKLTTGYRQDTAPRDDAAVVSEVLEHASQRGDARSGAGSHHFYFGGGRCDAVIFPRGASQSARVLNARRLRSADACGQKQKTARTTQPLRGLYILWRARRATEREGEGN